MKNPMLMTALLAATLGVLAVGGSASAAQKCFYLDEGSNKDYVKFSSDAPVELIEGMTTKIKGKVCYEETLKFDAKNPFDATFEVDLASIDTGIPLRNEHMRDNFLETKKYPKAIFKASSLSANAKPPLKNGQQVVINSTGKLLLHGKETVKKIPVKVTYFPESPTTKKRFKSGNMIRIQAMFPVSLAQHGIQRPEALFVKLAETVNVSVDAFATDDPNALK